MQHLTLRHGLEPLVARLAAVRPVTGDWTPQRRHVHADLVRATCLYAALDRGKSRLV